MNTFLGESLLNLCRYDIEFIILYPYNVWLGLPLYVIAVRMWVVLVLSHSILCSFELFNLSYYKVLLMEYWLHYSLLSPMNNYQIIQYHSLIWFLLGFIFSFASFHCLLLHLHLHFIWNLACIVLYIDFIKDICNSSSSIEILEGSLSRLTSEWLSS